MKEKKDLSIQVLHNSKLGSPRATRAGRSAHSIALSGFQGAGRLPQGEPQEVRRFRRGAYSKPTKGDCKPGWEDFQKKHGRGVSAPPGALLPRVPHGGIAAGAPTRASTLPLHSPPYSLLNGSPLHSGHALPSPFFSLFPTLTGALKRAKPHLPLHSPLYSLLCLQSLLACLFLLVLPGGYHGNELKGGFLR